MKEHNRIDRQRPRGKGQVALLRALILTSLLTGLIKVVAGQGAQQVQGAQYPFGFDQFEQSYSLINPAYIGQKGDLGIDLVSQVSGNSRGEVASYFATISYRINKQKEGNPQYIGLNLYADRAGPFLSATRFYGMYAIDIALNDSLTLSGGLAAGGLNYQADPTPRSPGGSALSADAKGGIWLDGEKYYIGVSINQALNNRITPFEEPLQLDRHFNFTAGGDVDLGEDFALRLSGIIRTGNAEQELLNILLKIKETISGGFAYRFRRKQVVPKVGFSGVRIGNNELQARVSAKLGLPGRQAKAFQTIGLSVSYNVR